jgi:hypothetical protein
LSRFGCEVVAASRLPPISDPMRVKDLLTSQVPGTRLPVSERGERRGDHGVALWGVGGVMGAGLGEYLGYV